MSKDNRIISVIAPPHFFCEHKSHSSYAKMVITRTALDDFNEFAYHKASSTPLRDSIATSVTLNAMGVRGLDAYKERHKLSSRNQAVLAILATHHAKQLAVIKATEIPVYKALAMIVSRG